MAAKYLRIKNLKLLLSAIDEENLKMISIILDGNCFFRAASLQLYGTENNHYYIRQALIRYMKIHRNTFISECNCEFNFDKFSQFGQWDEEINDFIPYVLSKFTNRTVKIYVWNSNLCRLDHFKDHHEYKAGDNYSKPLLFLQIDSFHYNALFQKDDIYASDFRGVPWPPKVAPRSPLAMEGVPDHGGG